MTDITSLSSIGGAEGNTAYTLEGNMWTDSMCLEYFTNSLTCVENFSFFAFVIKEEEETTDEYIDT